MLPVLLKQTLDILGQNSVQNMIAGFKATGIYPFDRDAVLKHLPDNTSKSDIYVADSLAKFLQEIRHPKPFYVVEKRKMLHVNPGQSISNEEILQVMQIQANLKNMKKGNASPSTAKKGPKKRQLLRGTPEKVSKKLKKS